MGFRDKIYETLSTSKKSDGRVIYNGTKDDLNKLLDSNPQKVYNVLSTEKNSNGLALYGKSYDDFLKSLNSDYKDLSLSDNIENVKDSTKTITDSLEVKPITMSATGNIQDVFNANLNDPVAQTKVRAQAIWDNIDKIDENGNYVYSDDDIINLDDDTYKALVAIANDDENKYIAKVKQEVYSKPNMGLSMQGVSLDEQAELRLVESPYKKKDRLESLKRGYGERFEPLVAASVANTKERVNNLGWTSDVKTIPMGDGKFQNEFYLKDKNGVTIPREQTQYYSYTRDLIAETEKLLSAPSKYDASNGFKNFAKGMADATTEAEFWLPFAGLAENMGVAKVAKKLNRNEELTTVEEALLESYINYGLAQEARQFNLSTGYKVGQGSAESIKFMLEMAIGGNITSSAGKAFVNKLAKKSLGKVGKAVVKFANSTSKAANFGKGALSTFVDPMFMASTWVNMSKAYADTHVHGDQDFSFVDMTSSYMDTVKEGATEKIGGILPTPSFLKDMYKFIPSYLKPFNGLMQNPLSEIGEEYMGSLFDIVRSWNPLLNEERQAELSAGAKSMWTLEGLKETSLMVAPLSILFGGANAGKMFKVNRAYSKSKQALLAELSKERYGLSQDDAKKVILKFDEAKTQEEKIKVAEKLHKAMYDSFIKENPTATQQERQMFADNVNKLLMHYANSNALYNQDIDDLSERYNKLSDKQKEKVDEALAKFTEQYVKVKQNEAFAQLEQQETEGVVADEQAEALLQETIQEADGAVADEQQPSLQAYDNEYGFFVKKKGDAMSVTDKSGQTLQFKDKTIADKEAKRLNGNYNGEYDFEVVQTMDGIVPQFAVVGKKKQPTPPPVAKMYDEKNGYGLTQKGDGVNVTDREGKAIQFTDRATADKEVKRLNENYKGDLVFEVRQTMDGVLPKFTVVGSKKQQLPESTQLYDEKNGYHLTSNGDVMRVTDEKGRNFKFVDKSVAEREVKRLNNNFNGKYIFEIKQTMNGMIPQFTVIGRKKTAAATPAKPKSEKASKTTTTQNAEETKTEESNASTEESRPEGEEIRRNPLVYYRGKQHELLSPTTKDGSIIVEDNIVRIREVGKDRAKTVRPGNVYNDANYSEVAKTYPPKSNAEKNRKVNPQDYKNTDVNANDVADAFLREYGVEDTIVALQEMYSEALEKTQSAKGLAKAEAKKELRRLEEVANAISKKTNVVVNLQNNTVEEVVEDAKDVVEEEVQTNEENTTEEVAEEPQIDVNEVVVGVNPVEVTEEESETIEPNSTNKEEVTETPTYSERILDNGDKETTIFNPVYQTTDISIERDGKIIYTDKYKDGILLDRTEFDDDGNITFVTRYSNSGNPFVKYQYENGVMIGQVPITKVENVTKQATTPVEETIEETTEKQKKRRTKSEKEIELDDFISNVNITYKGEKTTLDKFLADVLYDSTINLSDKVMREVDSVLSKLNEETSYEEAYKICANIENILAKHGLKLSKENQKLLYNNIYGPCENADAIIKRKFPRPATEELNTIGRKVGENKNQSTNERITLDGEAPTQEYVDSLSPEDFDNVLIFESQNNKLGISRRGYPVHIVNDRYFVLIDKTGKKQLIDRNQLGDKDYKKEGIKGTIVYLKGEDGNADLSKPYLAQTENGSIKYGSVNIYPLFENDTKKIKNPSVDNLFVKTENGVDYYSQSDKQSKEDKVKKAIESFNKAEGSPVDKFIEFVDMYIQAFDEKRQAAVAKLGSYDTEFTGVGNFQSLETDSDLIATINDYIDRINGIAKEHGFIEIKHLPNMLGEKIDYHLDLLEFYSKHPTDKEAIKEYIINKNKLNDIKNTPEFKNKSTEEQLKYVEKVIDKVNNELGLFGIDKIKKSENKVVKALKKISPKSKGKKSETKEEQTEQVEATKSNASNEDSIMSEQEYINYLMEKRGLDEETARSVYEWRKEQGTLGDMREMLDTNEYWYQEEARRFSDMMNLLMGGNKSLQLVSAKTIDRMLAYNRPVAVTSKNIDILKEWIGGLDIELVKPTDKGRASVDGSFGWYDLSRKKAVIVEGAPIDVVIHEIGWHATFDWARKHNKKMYDQMVDYATNAPLEVKEYVQGEYGELSEDEFIDEVGAKMFTDMARGKIYQKLRSQEARTWWEKVANLFKELWNKAMLKIFRKPIKDKAIDFEKMKGMEPADAMSYIAQQMIDGKVLGEFDYKDLSKRDQEQHFYGVNNIGSPNDEFVRRMRSDNAGLHNSENNSNFVEDNFNFNKEQYDLRQRGQLVVSKRFTPKERQGFKKGNGILENATYLVGGSQSTSGKAKEQDPFEREEQRREAQEQVLEDWAKANNLWVDNTQNQLSKEYEFLTEGGEADVYLDTKNNKVIKAIGLDYYVSPQLALDRIVLHNYLFGEITPLSIKGFGRNSEGYFKIIVEQPYIKGESLSYDEIEQYIESLGFPVRNRGNWTYANEDIYISDLHDENVIRTPEGNIAVIDADIRINTPELKYGGTRETEIEDNSNIRHMRAYHGSGADFDSRGKRMVVSHVGGNSGHFQDLETPEDYANIKVNKDNIKILEDWLRGLKINIVPPDSKYFTTRDNAHGVYFPKYKEVEIVDGADFSTAVHEIIWHATFDWAQENNKDLYDKMIEFALNAPSEIEELVDSMYGEFDSKENWIDELGAWVFTQRFKDRITSEEGRAWWKQLYDTFVKVFNKAWGYITGKREKVDLSKVSSMTPEDVIDYIIESALKGKNLADIDLDNAPYRQVYYRQNGESISYYDAQKNIIRSRERTILDYGKLFPHKISIKTDYYGKLNSHNIVTTRYIFDYDISKDEPIEKEIIYMDGEKLIYRYDDNLKLVEEIRYSDRYKTESFYNNGTIKRNTRYKLSSGGYVLDGLDSIYDEDGRVTFETFYKEGELVSEALFRYDSEGKLIETHTQAGKETIVSNSLTNTDYYYNDDYMMGLSPYKTVEVIRTPNGIKVVEHIESDFKPRYMRASNGSIYGINTGYGMFVNIKPETKIGDCADLWLEQLRERNPNAYNLLFKLGKKNNHLSDDEILMSLLRIKLQNWGHKDVSSISDSDLRNMTFEELMDIMPTLEEMGSMDAVQESLDKTYEMLHAQNVLFGGKFEEFWAQAMDDGLPLQRMMEALNAWRMTQGLDPLSDEYDVVNLRNYAASKSRTAIKEFRLSNEATALTDALKKFRNTIENSDELKALMERTVVVKDVNWALRGLKKYKEREMQQLIESYLLAKDLQERRDMGLPTRGVDAFKKEHTMSIDEFVAEFEKNFTDKEIEDLWKKIKDVTKISLDYATKYGIITQELKDTYLERDYYVPQRGFADEELEDQVRNQRTTSKGKAKITQKAEGGKTLASDPLAHIFEVTDDTIKKAYRNEYLHKIHELLSMEENKGFFGKAAVSGVYVIENTKNSNGEIVKSMIPIDDMDEEFVKEDEQTREAIKLAQEELKKMSKVLAAGSPTLQALEQTIETLENSIHYERSGAFISDKGKQNGNVVSFFYNGHYVQLEFADQRIADCLNDVHQHSKLQLEKIRKLNAYLSRIYTTYNPVFGVKNILRDWQQISAIGGSKYGPKFVAELQKNVFSGLPDLVDIARYLEMPFADFKEISPEFIEFMRSGAMTGFVYSNTIDDYKDQVRKAISDENSTTFNEIWDGAVKSLGFITEAGEIFMRYQAFKTAKQMGMSTHKATEVAKNCGVNFDKKGAGFKEGPGILINYVYDNISFSRAQMRGLAPMYEIMGIDKSKAQRKRLLTVFGSYIMMGFVSGLVQGMGDDEDETRNKAIRDEIPRELAQSNLFYKFEWSFEKANDFLNWILPNSIPISQNFIPFYGLGYSLSQIALNHWREFENKHKGLDEKKYAVIDHDIMYQRMAMDFGVNAWMNVCPLPSAITDGIKWGTRAIGTAAKAEDWEQFGREAVMASSSLMPTAVAPLFQALNNVDHLGRDIAHMPKFKNKSEYSDFYALRDLAAYLDGGHQEKHFFEDDKINPSKNYEYYLVFTKHLIDGYLPSFVGQGIEFADKYIGENYLGYVPDESTPKEKYNKIVGITARNAVNDFIKGYDDAMRELTNTKSARDYTPNMNNVIEKEARLETMKPAVTIAKQVIEELNKYDVEKKKQGKEFIKDYRKVTLQDYPEQIADEGMYKVYTELLKTTYFMLLEQGYVELEK